jgi:hypothetical protein
MFTITDHARIKAGAREITCKSEESNNTCIAETTGKSIIKAEIVVQMEFLTLF